MFSRRVANDLPYSFTELDTENQQGDDSVATRIYFILGL